MTDLQIKYQNLVLDRERLAKELELNERQISEVERHNLQTEDQARQQLGIAQHQADSARIQALASQTNAETNRLNYGVNYMNAETNRYNAETNRLNYGVNAMNAETNRLNYGVNAMNAETNRLNYAVNAQNAATNARNAEINAMNAQTNAGYLAIERSMTPYRQAQLSAQTEASRAAAANSFASAADVQAKTDSGYWQSAAWSNYAGAANNASRTLSSLGLLAGATAATSSSDGSIFALAPLARAFSSENMVQGAMWNWAWDNVQHPEKFSAFTDFWERAQERREKKDGYHPSASGEHHGGHGMKVS